MYPIKIRAAKNNIFTPIEWLKIMINNPCIASVHIIFAGILRLLHQTTRIKAQIQETAKNSTETVLLNNIIINPTIKQKPAILDNIEFLLNYFNIEFTKSPTR